MQTGKLILILLLTGTIAACATNSQTSYQQPALTQSTPLGLVWRTAAGQTLYTFVNDATGQSNCYGPCADKWPPFIAAANAKPVGDFDLTTRTDGSLQWRYQHQPLYSWIKDQKTGDTTGHGVKNVWFVARADAVPVKIYTGQQSTFLTDNRLHSLYTFDKDASGQSNCYQKCATLWPPLMAAENAQPSGPYGLVTRNDGGRQWSLNGRPLYTWVNDTQPGQTSGDGVKGVWHLAKPDAYNR